MKVFIIIYTIANFLILVFAQFYEADKIKDVVWLFHIDIFVMK